MFIYEFYLPPPQKKSPFFCAAFVFLPWNRRHWRNQGMTLALTVDKLYQLLIFSILLFSFHYFLKFFPNQVIEPCIYSHTYDLLFSYLIVIQSGSVSILWPNICPKSNDNNNCTLLLHTLKLQNNRKRDAMSMLLGIPPKTFASRDDFLLFWSTISWHENNPFVMETNYCTLLRHVR